MADLHYTREFVAAMLDTPDTMGALRADLLALHARVAALTEHAERVGAVLRALADFIERPDGGKTRMIDAIDAATGRYAETWGDLPDIVRALAEVPR